MPVIPVLGRWEQRAQEFKSGLLDMSVEDILITVNGCGKDHLNQGQDHSLGRGTKTV